MCVCVCVCVCLTLSVYNPDSYLTITTLCALCSDARFMIPIPS